MNIINFYDHAEGYKACTIIYCIGDGNARIFEYEDRYLMSQHDTMHKIIK